MFDDIYFMNQSIKLAREALQSGEVPIGCVFVYENKIIGTGRNTVNETKNATRHAEINALDKVFEFSKKMVISLENLFPNCTLYVTVEPCAMCADAISLLKLKRLVFGCSNERFGGCGSIIDVFSLFKYESKLEIMKNIQADASVELLKEFYKGVNPNAPTGKAKRKHLME